MEIATLHQYFLASTGITTDTRNINKDNFYIALKGTNFNGNSFTKKAFELGAKYVLIDEQEYKINEQCLLVDNCLAALQELAKFHRNYLTKIKIIGLTGSNGKTTTKELIHAVLSQKYKTKATKGNLNNHIGVPLTLLSFDKSTEIGIVEMGANHQKEIEFLSSIAQPDYGYITNFGKAHLEGFGGVQGVIKGKSELYDYIEFHKKIAIINLEDPIQETKKSLFNTYTFGINKEAANVNIEKVIADPMVKISFENTTINSHLIGLYNANNINAAVAIGKLLNVSNDKIKAGVEGYIPENNRSQLLTKKDYEIILDAYNANPSSMQAALTNFFQLEQAPKTAILGDMFELGSESTSEHTNLVQFCQNQPHITFHFIGSEFYKSKIEAPNMCFYEKFETFSEAITHKALEKGLLLIKGSRGMSLERTLDIL